MAAALRLSEGQSIAPLAEVRATTIKGSSLKPGMVILDDLGCPAAVVDHRIGSAGPRTGVALYLVEDLDKGGWFTHPFGENARINVAAK